MSGSLLVRISGLIVDDEPLARRKLRRLLRAAVDFEVVAEAANGAEAIEAMTALRPDVVFLDVQMPQIDGLDVIRAVPEAELPLVVFVTAYSRHAVKAFELQALDYLVKPFDKRRFAGTLQRVRERLAAADPQVAKRLLAALESMRSAPVYLDRVLVRDSGSATLVPVGRIDWIEAYGNYVKLHTGDTTHLLRESMKALERQLDPTGFSRIHRSTIVNLDRVQQLNALFHGDYQVVLTDGTELRLSRSYRDRLRSSWGHQL